MWPFTKREKTLIEEQMKTNLEAMRKKSIPWPDPTLIREQIEQERKHNEMLRQIEQAQAAAKLNRIYTGASMGTAFQAGPPRRTDEWIKANRELMLEQVMTHLIQHGDNGGPWKGHYQILDAALTVGLLESNPVTLSTEYEVRVTKQGKRYIEEYKND